MEQNLGNFIKYCLGYVKLTRQRGLAAQQKYAVNIPAEYCGLVGLLNGDTDGSLGELINLETFYSYDPKRVPEAEREKYEREKALANKIEDIYNKYRNDQFRKHAQVRLDTHDDALGMKTRDIQPLLDKHDNTWDIQVLVDKDGKEKLKDGSIPLEWTIPENEQEEEPRA